MALSEQRHFGRAAAFCNVSQPTLSIQIQKLEEELGVTLVERGSTPLLMTRVGEQVVARARTILSEASQIRALANDSHDPESGSLRLGIIPTLAPYLLPHVLGAVKERFPRLELLLIEEKTAILIDELHDGRIDAAILALPLPEPAGLHEEQLFVEPFVLATPQSGSLASRATITLDDLHGKHLLLLDEGHCLREQALAVCKLAGATEVNDFRATGLETLRHMVAMDVGITLLPLLATMAPTPPIEGVALVPFRPPCPNRELAMCWRHNTARDVFLRKLAALIRERANRTLQGKP